MFWMITRPGTHSLRGATATIKAVLVALLAALPALHVPASAGASPLYQTGNSRGL
jgi:hypothetical protein